MLKRLLLGIVIGLVLGGAVAAGLVLGLHWATFSEQGAAGPTLAYALAAVTGALVGLVAGKPIWARGGQIEAGLKAVFGALLSAGAMYALRTWVHLDVDLASLHAGAGPIGDLPAAALPLVAAALGGLYELDNTPGTSGDGGAKKRVGPTQVRVAEPTRAEDDEPPPAARKRTR